MRLVRITWIDSCTNGGWKFDRDIDAWLDRVPVHAESIGYVVRETMELLVVAGSVIGLGHDLQYSCLSVIPRSAVTKVEDIYDDGQ